MERQEDAKGHKLPPEIQAVRQGFAKKNLQAIMLDEMARSCPGMSYEHLLQAAMSLHTNAIKDIDYADIGKNFRQSAGREQEERVNTIRQAVREYNLNGALSLQWYYEQGIDYWLRDLPYILQLSEYLFSPSEQRATLQERSYEIFEEENFLLENPEFLRRLGLSREQLNIIAQPDPLMLAVQGRRSFNGEICYHFAVEEREAYYKLYPVLGNTEFCSLILGAGWRLAGNLFQLPYQLGRENQHHEVWYYGNLDLQGIKLWYQLRENAPKGVKLRLAVDFYRALLLYSPVKAKEQEEWDELALEAFCQEFDPEEGNFWREVLLSGRYYPKHLLGLQEAQRLFKELDRKIHTAK